MLECEICARRVSETAYSEAAQATCCLSCHVKAAPASEATRYRPPASPRRAKPTPYAQTLERAWQAMEAIGTVFPLVDGTGRLMGWCPACKQGTVTIMVLGSDHEPRLRLAPCSAGCSEEQIARSLQ